ncbi:unnamed protein product [Caenorhabditis brenneri]
MMQQAVVLPVVDTFTAKQKHQSIRECLQRCFTLTYFFLLPRIIIPELTIRAAFFAVHHHALKEMMQQAVVLPVVDTFTAKQKHQSISLPQLMAEMLWTENACKDVSH